MNDLIGIYHRVTNLYSCAPPANSGSKSAFLHSKFQTPNHAGEVMEVIHPYYPAWGFRVPVTRIRPLSPPSHPQQPTSTTSPQNIPLKHPASTLHPPPSAPRHLQSNSAYLSISARSNFFKTRQRIYDLMNRTSQIRSLQRNLQQDP